MQRDGLMDESDNFLTRFGNGNAAGEVGHIGAVITFSFLDDHYVLHLFKSLFLKPCLLQYTAERTRRQIQTGLSGNSNGTGFVRMFELPVASFRSDEIPAILF